MLYASFRRHLLALLLGASLCDACKKEPEHQPDPPKLDVGVPDLNVDQATQDTCIEVTAGLREHCPAAVSGMSQRCSVTIVDDGRYVDLGAGLTFFVDAEHGVFAASDFASNVCPHAPRKPSR